MLKQTQSFHYLIDRLLRITRTKQSPNNAQFEMKMFSYFVANDDSQITELSSWSVNNPREAIIPARCLIKDNLPLSHTFY